MRDHQLAGVFIELADTLVDEFDLIDFLYRLTVRCVDLLGVAAAGLLLADQRGALQVVAASTERTRLLELLQLQTAEKRPVYAHATTTAPWLQLGRPILEGRTASIPSSDLPMSWAKPSVFIACPSTRDHASIH